MISVVIPCYNNAHFLPSCLASLDGSPMIEIIVVNDGSDEANTTQIASFDGLCSFEHQDQVVVLPAPIQVVHHPQNLGTFLARKTGVLASTGNYVLFLDPDDTLADNAIAKIERHLMYYDSELVLFYMQAKGGYVARQRLPMQARYDHNLMSLAFFGKYFISGYIGGKVFATRQAKQALDILGFVQEKFILCEDLVFVYVFLAVANNVSTLPEALYVYLRHESSITKKQSEYDIKIEQLKLAQEYLKKAVACPDVAQNAYALPVQKRINQVLLSNIYFFQAKQKNSTLLCLRSFWTYPTLLRFIWCVIFLLRPFGSFWILELIKRKVYRQSSE